MDASEEVHVVSPQESKRFTCPMCPYSTNYKAHLKVHIFTHSSERNFSCDQCDYSGKTMNTLRNHKKMVHSTTVHRCPECDFVTKNYLSVRLHIRNRHREAVKKWKCDLCGFETAHLNSLKCHKMTHFDEKPFSCDHCDFVTKHAASLRYHITSVHMKVKKYHCSKCDFRASNISNLRQHEWTHNAPGKFECEVCHEVLKNHRILKVHMRNRHSGMKPYICPTCGRAFTNNHNMKRHQRIHKPPTNDIHCALCPRTFTFIENLRRHMKFIHGNLEKPQCHECGKRFYGKANLARHIETVHDKKRNFFCPVCNKCYSSPECLKRHLNVHDLKEDINRPEPMEGHGQFISGIPRKKYVSMVQKIRQQQTDFKLLHMPYVCVYQMPFYLTDEENKLLFSQKNITLNSEMMRKIAKLPHKNKNVFPFNVSTWKAAKMNCNPIAESMLMPNDVETEEKYSTSTAVNGVHITGEPVPNFEVHNPMPKVFGTLETNSKDNLEHTVYVKIEVMQDQYEQMVSGASFTGMTEQSTLNGENGCDFDCSNITIKQEVTNEQYNESQELTQTSRNKKGKKTGAKIDVGSLLNKRKTGKKDKTKCNNQTEITKTLKEKKKRVIKDKTGKAGSGRKRKLINQSSNGSKNNCTSKIIERCDQGIDGVDQNETIGKKKRGRPKGSKSATKMGKSKANKQNMHVGEGNSSVADDQISKRLKMKLNKKLSNLKDGTKKEQNNGKILCQNTDSVIIVESEKDNSHQNKFIMAGSDLINNNKPMDLRDIFLNSMSTQSSGIYGSKLNPQELFPEIDLAVNNSHESYRSLGETIKVENCNKTVQNDIDDTDGISVCDNATGNKKNVWSKLLGIASDRQDTSALFDSIGEKRLSENAFKSTNDQVDKSNEESLKRQRKQASPNKRDCTFNLDNLMEKPVSVTSKSGRKKKPKSIGWDFVSDGKSNEKKRKISKTDLNILEGQQVNKKLKGGTSSKKTKTAKNRNVKQDAKKSFKGTDKNISKKKLPKQSQQCRKGLFKAIADRKEGANCNDESDAMYIQWIVRNPDEEQPVSDTVVLNTKITNMEEDVQVQLVSDPVSHNVDIIKPAANESPVSVLKNSVENAVSECQSTSALNAIAFGSSTGSVIRETELQLISNPVNHSAVASKANIFTKKEYDDSLNEISGTLKKSSKNNKPDELSSSLISQKKMGGNSAGLINKIAANFNLSPPADTVIIPNCFESVSNSNICLPESGMSKDSISFPNSLSKGHAQHTSSSSNTFIGSNSLSDQLLEDHIPQSNECNSVVDENTVKNGTEEEKTPGLNTDPGWIEGKAFCDEPLLNNISLFQENCEEENVWKSALNEEVQNEGSSPLDYKIGICNGDVKFDATSSKELENSVNDDPLGINNSSSKLFTSSDSEELNITDDFLNSDADTIFVAIGENGEVFAVPQSEKFDSVFANVDSGLHLNGEDDSDFVPKLADANDIASFKSKIV